MRHRISQNLLAALVLFVFTAALPGQQIDERRDNIRRNYIKTEVRVPTRDGKTLHTVIFSPRDQSRKYPIMLNRTPYSCQPYGTGTMPGQIGPSKYLETDGFIFVKQDVRGRWMSQGQYDNMRPHVVGDSQIDESSDTYDTIQWLLQHVRNHNGKVGMWGISYPGFYTAAALAEHHPALVAASPQAPIADFFFDDFHHHGAYLLGYFLATNTFGYQHQGPVNYKWYPSIRPPSQDAFSFYLSLGPLSNAGGYFGPDNFFWQQLVEHPNYDSFWQQRNILPHLKNVKTNVMTVGGWLDAEDLYGPLNIYRAIEKNNPDTFNTLVMGPWDHGQWSKTIVDAAVGNISFGQNISDFYQREIEAPFFRHFLKSEGEKPRFEAMVFDTGTKAWRAFDKWPPAQAVPEAMYLRALKRLSPDKPDGSDGSLSQFISNPANPVPYRKVSDIRFQFTPRAYMTDDQRFASARSDVLVFETPVLKQPLTMAGELMAHLDVTTTGTSADWIVKLINVYPDDYGARNVSPTGANLNGYQQMVRSEVIRGRFRNSYEKPEPFVAGEVANIRLPLQDVFHTFRPGHRIMIHVQSTWFPLIDLNPQKYVDNIFKAQAKDFITATHTVRHSPDHASRIEFTTIPAK